MPPGAEALLRVTASSTYRAFIDGRFLGHGPAVGPHGFYRMDELPLPAGEHVIAIEVVSYSVNGYTKLNQPGFLQAEVVAGEQVLAFTDADTRSGFDCRILTERVQRVQRYSFQRPMVEVYSLNESSHSWRIGGPAGEVPCELQPEKKPLPRRVGYPDYELVQPRVLVNSGRFEIRPPAKPWRRNSLTEIGPKLMGYKIEDLEVILSDEIGSIVNITVNSNSEDYPPQSPLELRSGDFHILDLGTNLTGFVGLRVVCDQPVRLYISFDELMTQAGDVDFLRNDAVSGIRYDLAPGSYELESLEPYTLRFLKLALAYGACRVEGIFLREYACPGVDRASFTCSNKALDKIFQAARQTFRQNALDIFMDCPGRERAGWLCDSLFTARGAYALTGSTTIEKAFLENFLLPERFECLPEGMLPMCYPADHYDGGFIPNWAMFFVLQLPEYLARSDDHELVGALRPRVLAVLECLAKYRNSDGLLEKLPGWVFVEWSWANNYVQDVNYPSNMLYAATLETAGRLYDRPDLIADAANVRKQIVAQSFDGEFFVDNAMRVDGRLSRTENRTETCQYYATVIASLCSAERNILPAQHQQLSLLVDRLLNDFGPLARRITVHQQRKGVIPGPEISHPTVFPANMFIGNVLRMELLSRAGRTGQIACEMVKLFSPMAELTGTLWEDDSPAHSCNHGFGSVVADMMYRDLLGVRRIDRASRKIDIQLGGGDLEWCEGAMPICSGLLRLRWRRRGGSIVYQAQPPEGYVVQVDNPCAVEIVQEPWE